MANSKQCGPFGTDPFGLLDKRATLGAGMLTRNFGHTPGPLGIGHQADPTCNPFTWATSSDHAALRLDSHSLFWDYDPNKLLQDERLNPGFVRAAESAMKNALLAGLRPVVHEAYRTPEESDRKHALYLKHKGGKANPAWGSAHNYGLGMDVYLFNEKGQIIDNEHPNSVKGSWYTQYKNFAKGATQLVWGAPIDDSDHFEYHPKWQGCVSDSRFRKVKKWAQDAAMAQPGAGVLPNGMVGPVEEPAVEDWMPFVWWAAGAGGTAPAAAYLSKHPVPS